MSAYDKTRKFNHPTNSPSKVSFRLILTFLLLFLILTLTCINRAGRFQLKKIQRDYDKYLAEIVEAERREVGEKTGYLNESTKNSLEQIAEITKEQNMK